MVQAIVRPRDETGIKVSSEIAGDICFICDDEFNRRQIVVRILGGKYVHKRSCWYKYIARAVKVYELDRDQIVDNFHVSRRSAYKILADLEELAKW